VRLRVRPLRRLAGHVAVPGDKSVSHRAALLGALAEGVTEIHGYLEAEDCLCTLAAVAALGVEVSGKGPGEYRIAGAGRRGFSEPADIVNCGNSGTMARLLLGVLAGQPFWTLLTADASMRSRPMGRVTEPLTRMGASIVGRADGTRLPLAVRGARPLRAIDYALPVASAQVKSAVLLAGLAADGPVSVTEPAASRDHSERMLRQFGAHLERQGTTTTITPGLLKGTNVLVPGDISSAAFLLVAGLVAGDGRVVVQGVGLNPTRTGILESLAEMGADLQIEPDPSATGEPCGRVTARTSVLRGTTIGGALIPRLVDEVPALAVAAALAHGRTEIRDAAELRVKESDRLAALAHELGALGAQIDERTDGLVIEGGAPLRGARVQSRGDHRIAMALAVAGLVAEGETIVDDSACIATSFPQFTDLVNTLAGEPVITVEP
jgi:3-phosphoshikimate 1-carboxyvinyltransferase